ncbi:MAG: YfhO family protein [Clostridiales bacterium]|nr:YfhO family protein [Clostridiales bacterium]MDU1042035.1 YfhO family protein [Clostridiales bacterium]
MHNRKKKELNRVWACVIPGLITLGIMIAAYITKGIFPFGGNRVDYFDNMQQVAPIYTHMWDVLHGKAALWFDWYTALGTNFSMSISAFSLLSPFNLFLCVIPRDLILESIAYLNVAKAVCASVAMYLFISYMFRDINYRFKLILSVSFSLCGYVSMYSPVFTPWMDIVAIFPLVMWALFKLLKEGKKAFFIIMVAGMFIINYYLAAMVMLYVLFVSGLYIIFMAKKRTRLRNAWDMIVGTLTGAAISAFALVPVFTQLSGSQRSAENSGLLKQFRSILFTNIFQESSLSTFQRFMMLFGLSFAGAVVIVGVVRSWKKKESDSPFYTCITIIAMLPIFVQGVNTIWHFGSYFGYTLRMGFLISFTLIFAAARYMAGPDTLVAGEHPYDTEDGKHARVRPGELVSWIIGLGAMAVYVIAYRYIPTHWEGKALLIFACGLGPMVIFYLTRILIHQRKSMEKLRPGAIIPLVIAELFIGFYSFLGLPKFYEAAPFQDGNYVQLANAVKKDLDIEDSKIDRIINPDLSLNANYPLILRRPALSSFTAAIADGSQRSASAFGYSQYFTWMLDSGGTAFSNALFHITHAVNITSIDPRIASPVETKGGHTLYNMKYVLPYGVTLSNAAISRLNTELEEVAAFNKEIRGKADHKYANDVSGMENYKTRLADEWIVTQNAFYHALSSSDDNIIEKAELKDLKKSKSDRKGEVTFTLNTKSDEDQAVYLALKDNEEPFEDVSLTPLDRSVEIIVNGNPVITSTIGDARNKEGMNDFNNNLISLGTYRGEKLNVTLKFKTIGAMNRSQLSVGSLSLNKLNSLCRTYEGSDPKIETGKSGMDLVVNAKDPDSSLLLPVICSTDLNITVNGKKISVSKENGVGGLFTRIRLEPGSNNIQVRWEAKGLKKGALISLAATALFVIIWAVKRGKKASIPNWLLWVAGVIFFTVFTGAVLAVLVIPAAFAIPAIIAWKQI